MRVVNNPLFYTACVLLLTLVPVTSEIQSIVLATTVQGPVDAGTTLFINYTVTANDNYNLSSTVRFFPYINGIAYGAEVGLLTSVSSTVSSGHTFIPLPWSLNVSSTTQVPLQLYYQSTPTTYTVGRPPPSNALSSNTVYITIQPRIPIRPNTASSVFPHIGMYFETWFTPLNFNWYNGTGSAEAIPIIGRYASVDLLSISQQAAWFIQTGIEYVVVDWTNNLWNIPHWNERNPNIQELVNATNLHIGVYSYLKHTLQWNNVPQFILLLGLNNGPTTPLPALMEELDYINTAYIQNTSVGIDMMVTYLGKPLVIIFDGSGADNSNITHPAFTIRWMSSQNQITHFNKRGYWSWMDGSITPEITVFNNSYEAATAAPAYFASNGWTDNTTAMGRSGGLTYIQTVSNILRNTVASSIATTGVTDTSSIGPYFLFTCQWNEYAGQNNGNGYGPNDNIYVDSYSADLSNDMEPTSLFACGYPRPGRSCGGYGYKQLNILNMMNYGIKNPSALDNTTVISIISPAVGDVSNYTDGVSTITISYVITTFCSICLMNQQSYLQNITGNIPVQIIMDDINIFNITNPTGNNGINSFSININTAGNNSTPLLRTFPHRLRIETLPASATPYQTVFPLSLHGVDETVPLTNPVNSYSEVFIWLPEAVAEQNYYTKDYVGTI